VDEPVSAKRVIAAGYDRLGSAFTDWQAQNPVEVTSWFLGEVLARLGEGSRVLELGCGPGTADAQLSAGRRYVGVDLSRVQLSFAQRRVPSARFVRADFTTMIFRPASFDGVVGFYAFNHVPQEELALTFAQVFRWLRPGGHLMVSLGANDTANAIEQDWLGVPMFFAGFKPETNERLLRETGFHLEISEVREAVMKDGEVERFHWVMARRPAQDYAQEPDYHP
jgi:cyclopropane fatty-acyl-phospholipid synthase-like methyltransferase